MHVSRDGRDACMSYHNHGTALTSETLAQLDRIGIEDETLARFYPRFPDDPADFFHQWLTEGVHAGDGDGSPLMSFFHLERSWWEERHRPNVLLVHYNDLKADLLQEMRRIADFLDIAVAPDLWQHLKAAAEFEAMRRDGTELMGRVAGMFTGGAARFFHRGANGRWRGIFRDEDLALYQGKVLSAFTPELASWVEHGRRGGPEQMQSLLRAAHGDGADRGAGAGWGL